MSALWLQPQAEVSDIRNVGKYFLRSAVIFFLIYHSTSNANTVPPIPAPSISVPLFSCNARISAWCGPPSYIVSVDSTSTTVVAPIGVISAACAAIGSGYVESLLPETPAYQQNYWCNIPASAGGNYYTQTNQAHPEPTSCPAGYVWNGSTVLCDPLGPPTCPTGYELGGSAPNWTCTSDCPIDRLPDLPKDDVCAQSLEKGRGVDIDGKCPQPSDKLTPNGQLECFANKVAATNATARPQISYSGPSAIVRNPAYQKHLQDVWDKMIELNGLSDPDEIKACQILRNKVIAEKGCDSDKKCTKGRPRCLAGSHCIDYRPADFSNHSTGTAFDVSWDTVQGIVAELTPLPPAPMTSQQRLQFQRSAISAWLATPTACSLTWGGNFQDPDYVHFQLP